LLVRPGFGIIVKPVFKSISTEMFSVKYPCHVQSLTYFLPTV
jgi:hypothetical protein